MRFLWISFVLFGAAKLDGAVNNNGTHEETLSRRGEKEFIAYGEPYDREKYPYLVALYIEQGFGEDKKVSMCTGTLISPLIVLTAAHCTWKVRPSNIRVLHGDVSPSSYQRSHSVSRIHQHSNYAFDSVLSDISLLKLVKPFENVTKYAVISGKPEDFDNGKALDCVTIGFGINEHEKPELVGYIANASVKFGPNACELDINDPEFEEQLEEFLCSRPDRRQTCQGDSGGPLICDGLQYGICNFGYNYKYSNRDPKCGDPDVQTAHLFLYLYRHWIAEHSGSARGTLRWPAAAASAAVLWAVLRQRGARR